MQIFLFTQFVIKWRTDEAVPKRYTRSWENLGSAFLSRVCILELHGLLHGTRSTCAPSQQSAWNTRSIFQLFPKCLYTVRIQVPGSWMTSWPHFEEMQVEPTESRFQTLCFSKWEPGIAASSPLLHYSFTAGCRIGTKCFHVEFLLLNCFVPASIISEVSAAENQACPHAICSVKEQTLPSIMNVKVKLFFFLNSFKGI